MAVPQMRKRWGSGWMRHKGRGGWVASGWSAVFPASVAMFKSSHDPSTALGMTAGEKEREAGRSCPVTRVGARS